MQIMVNYLQDDLEVIALNEDARWGYLLGWLD